LRRRHAAVEELGENDGNLMVPDKPGHGIEWNEKAVAKFAQ